MAFSKKVTFGILKLAENFWFLIFCNHNLIMSSDESQSKAQFNLQSLGENKTGYCAENIEFVSTGKNLKKIPHLFTLHFYTLLKMYCHAEQCYFTTS